MKIKMVLLVLVFAIPNFVYAHIILTKPVARLFELPRNTQDGVKDDQFKGLACGEYFSQGARVEPAPLASPTEFSPGETITVEWDETIDHFGRFVIDFSPVRPSSNADFQTPPLLVITDVSEAGISRNTPKKHTTTITLPSQPCDQCVLRLRQQMDDQITNGQAQQYFACADIKIVAANSNPTDNDTSTSETGTGALNDSNSTGKGAPRMGSCGIVSSVGDHWEGPPGSSGWGFMVLPMLVLLFYRRREIIKI